MRIRLSDPNTTLIGCLRRAGQVVVAEVEPGHAETIEVVEPLSGSRSELIAAVVAWWDGHPDVALEVLAAAAAHGTRPRAPLARARPRRPVPRLEGGAVLGTAVDAAGVQHLGYRSARRTLCLEHLLADCMPGREARSMCEDCEDVRRRLGRGGRLPALGPLHAA